MTLRPDPGRRRLGRPPLSPCPRTIYSIPTAAGAELAGNYQFNAVYNPDGTIQSTGHPAAAGMPAEALIVGYDNLARPTSLTGRDGYVGNARYAPTGELSQITLNGSGKKIWHTWHHEPGTGRLKNSRIDRYGEPVVDMNAHYDYDAAGNVVSIADTPRRRTP